MAVGQICIILTTLVQPELITFALRAAFHLNTNPTSPSSGPTRWRRSASFGWLVQRTEISKPSH